MESDLFCQHDMGHLPHTLKKDLKATQEICMLDTLLYQISHHTDIGHIFTMKYKLTFVQDQGGVLEPLKECPTEIEKMLDD